MYRTQTKIVADVLTTTKECGVEGEGVGITTILRKENLSHTRSSRILKNLLSSGLLEININEYGNKYKISNRGRQFLEEYYRFEEYMQSFRLNILFGEAT